MSLDQCIPGMVERGEITPEKADEMRGLYGELERDYRRQFGDQAAASMASEATLAALERNAARKKRIALGQVTAQKRIVKELSSYDGGAHGDGPLPPSGATALFDGDGRAHYSNVEGRRKAIKARTHKMIDGILAEHSQTVTGQVRNRAQLANIVRELFGEASDDPAARELADAWQRASEMLRQRFNAAGGAIGKLEHWGLPQSHDSRAVRAAGYEPWRAEILPRLDRARMVDERTGAPFSDEALELALKDVFETIRSDGFNKVKPGGNNGAGALANQRNESRFLIFKSADDWMAYSEKFGAGTAFDTMMSHVDGMSRDIARMEILGPNPDASVQWLKDTIERSAQMDQAPDSKAGDKAFKATKQIDRLYAEITGAAGRPESRRLALGFSTVRSLQTAAKLGSAFLSAPTDTAFQMTTRAFNGLPVAKTIADVVTMFAPGGHDNQRMALRRGLIADEWGKRAAAQGRYLGEELTGEVSRRLAEGVLRLSGLSRWTQAGRFAFGKEFFAHLTEEAGKRFDALDAPLRNQMAKYGIGADDWDAIRTSKRVQDGGADWLEVENMPQAAGDKLLEMVNTETDYAVPVPDLRTRAMFNAAIPKGAWMGEIIRSAALFKSFGVSVVMMHGRRTMEQAGINRARYAGGLIIGTTAMGALSLQLKAIAAGKDPRPMSGDAETTGQFWGAAILQGGGFGIFGDFLGASQNRFGGGFSASLAGPLAQTANNLVNVPFAKSPAWAAVKLAHDELPGQSLWYTRLAFDRLVTDQIQEQLDPNYRASWRRMEKRAREQKTRYYWNPGETAPDRAPDVSNALGGNE